MGAGGRNSPSRVQGGALLAGPTEAEEIYELMYRMDSGERFEAFAIIRRPIVGGVAYSG